MDYISYVEGRVIDINSEYFGVPRSQLMENAGKASFEEIGKRFDLSKKIFSVICGLGNNGGDGFVLARHLLEKNVNCKVFLLGKKEEIKTKEAKKAFKKLEEIEAEIVEVKDADSLLESRAFACDVIVDAVLGTGVEGNIKEPLKSIILAINLSKVKKVSLDIPSGLGSRNRISVSADLTIAFHKPKIGTEKLTFAVKGIGIPEKAELYAGPGELIVNLKRKKNSKKGDNGRVLVIGGGIDYYGAPLLAAKGALSAGCDITYLLVPEINFEVTRSLLPDFIVSGYEGKFLNENALAKAEEMAKKSDCIAIGMGLGLREETKEALDKILEFAAKSKKNIVIDGDALKLCDKEIAKNLNAVFTPHAKEFEMLTGEKLNSDIEERKRAVSKHAKRFSSTILLKGNIDIISSPEKTKLNETGNEGMTKGGTGDVLAGLTAGLIAQHIDNFTAACCAAFVNGAAGDFLYKLKHYGYSASDLADEIPYTIKRIMDFEEE